MNEEIRVNIPALSVQNATYHYRSRFVKDSDPVLKNVNCSIESGKILGILGPNGSGKSTMAQTLGSSIFGTRGMY